MIVDPVYALILLVLGVLLMFVIPIKNEIETWLDRKNMGRNVPYLIYVVSLRDLILKRINIVQKLRRGMSIN